MESRETEAPALRALWPGAVEKGDQLAFPAVLMRGGTSRGAFLRSDDLPADPALRDRVILAVYGSPDARQIDGIGGATPLTSKVAIVSRSDRPDADVDYLFGQVAIDRALVDYGGNCGNMLAAVGPYAVDEGLVPAEEPVARVRIHNVNTGRVVVAEVPVRAGRSRTAGGAQIPGVPGAGAPIPLDFAAAGGTLGRGLLPTGMPRETLETEAGRFEVSLVDAANPTAFVSAEALGLAGAQVVGPLDDGVVVQLRAIRAAAAARLGLATSPAQATEESPGVPKAYAVARPAAYVDSAGRRVEAGDVTILGRGLTFGVLHAAYAATVAVCTAAASRIDGTVVSEHEQGNAGAPVVYIGHPGGVLPVEIEIEVEDSGSGVPELKRVAIVRTARRLFSGLALVPRSVLDDG